ncbi:peptidyl-prolyl cis-trans isomerase [Aliagarivorans marinus]|uniref:peptidyl-prolyl cis-trans isomerase n=1 Tax=Aliagarivorans marinus TaxID=561965 RepID=UPI000417ED0E|nr:peptidyl-prolyl cis-trans isomerase [Aliagarivorans marinus]
MPIEQARKILKQPLFIFFAVALAVLITDNFLLFERQSKNVVVNDRTLSSFVNVNYGLDNAQMISSYLRSLDEQERQELETRFLENEALYHFAISRALDKNDEELKSIISAKARNVVEMMVNAEQGLPSTAEAKQFFEQNSQRYTRGERYNLLIVNRSAPSEEILHTLQNEQPTIRQVVSLSNLPNLEKVLREAEPQQIETQFDTQLASDILQQTDGNWYGPYQSDKGFHWVKLDRLAPVDVEFQQIEEQVKQDLYQQQVDSRYQALINDLVAQLNIREGR